MALATYKDLCIDAVDAHRLGAFYATALGLEWEKDGQDAVLRGPTPAHTIWINQVPEGRTVKNRVHIDVHTGRHSNTVAELVAAGATVVNDTDFTWTLMTDPEGQEFCAFVRETPPDYKLYEICVDCADGPPAAAITRWWGEVFGVEAITEDGKEWWWIEKVPGVPFDGFSFVAVPEPNTAKNRVHWDVTGDKDALIAAGATMVLPQAEGRGWDEEVERLLALGTHLVDDHRKPDGTGWATLADPEGNESLRGTQ